MGNRTGQADFINRALCCLLLVGCKSEPAAPPPSADALPTTPSAAAVPEPPKPPEPVPAAPPPKIRTFDTLDIEWKPVFDTPTEIVWNGKVTRATGTKRQLQSKPCTLTLRGEAGVKSQIFVRCDNRIIYNSKQQAGGGYFAYSFTLVERIPESPNGPYRYRLAYTDTGNRPDRPQAQLSTGMKSKVIGEDPPDFTVEIRFSELSRPRTGRALFPPKAPIPIPYSGELRVTQVSEMDDIRIGDRCALTLAPYAVETDGSLWCTAKLTCGDKTLYGASNRAAEGRITPCKTDEAGRALTGSGDDYNRFIKAFPKLTTDISAGAAILETDTGSVACSAQNAEMAPPSPED